MFTRCRAPSYILCGNSYIMKVSQYETAKQFYWQKKNMSRNTISLWQMTHLQRNAECQYSCTEQQMLTLFLIVVLKNILWNCQRTLELPVRYGAIETTVIISQSTREKDTYVNVKCDPREKWVHTRTASTPRVNRNRYTANKDCSKPTLAIHSKKKKVKSREKATFADHSNSYSSASSFSSSMKLRILVYSRRRLQKKLRHWDQKKLQSVELAKSIM